MKHFEFDQINRAKWNPRVALKPSDQEYQDINPTDLKALCGTTKARMIFTDPPYGVSYKSKSKKQHASIANDQLRDVQMVLGRSDYHWAHEPLIYACRIGKNCEWLGDRTATTLLERTDADLAKMSKEDMLTMLTSLKAQGTLWDEKRDPPSLYIHSTQKPVSLATRGIRNSSMPGDHVLELFAGSGSTIISAELQDRNCLAMELSRGNCDAILRRTFETFENVEIKRNGKRFNPASVGAEK